MVGTDAVYGDIFFVVSTPNAYIPVRVGFCDGKWSFGWGGEFRFPFAFVGFLYDEYQFSDFVIVRYSVFFLFVVCDGLGMSLAFE